LQDGATLFNLQCKSTAYPALLPHCGKAQPVWANCNEVYLFSASALSPHFLGFSQVRFVFRTNLGTFLYFLFAALGIDKPLLRGIEPLGGFGISFAMIRR